MRLHKRQFENWLKTKPPTEIVGHHRNCHTCPIGNFYYEASGGCEVAIFSDDRPGGYVIDRGYIRTRAPAWAEDFMFTVDGDANGQISAGRALEVLAGGF